MADKDPRAPHGYDDDGNPLAPFGLKVDGTPRLSKRGAAPGSQGNVTAPTAKKKPQLTSNRTDQQRKAMLVDLADQLIVIPLITASAAPPVRRKLGKHGEALAGDAVIVHTLAPSFADGLIMAAQARPGLLSWMDTVEKKAPFLMLAQVGIAATKAFISQHMNPDPELNRAGAVLFQIKAREMASLVEQEARSLGLDPDSLAEAA